MKSDLLSSLPPELICAILIRLSTPQDLYSVIRASPLIYIGAFTASREFILRNVAQNAFEPTTLSEALMVVRFLKSDNPSNNEGRDYYQRRLNFLLHLIREAKAEPPPGPMLAEGIALCGLFRSFEIFAQDCSKQFLDTAEWEIARKSKAEVIQEVSPHDLQKRSPPSDIELARLQRGFLRYTAFQNLMHTSEMLSHECNCVSSEHVVALFAEFTPWEIEEIACVHQYTVDWLKKILDEVEDDFIKSVAATEQPSSSKFLPSGEDKSVDHHSMEAQLPFVSNNEDELGPEGVSWQPSEFTEGSSTIMFLDSEKQSQPKLIEHLATLGFKFLRILIKADNPQRRSIINRNYHYKYANLGYALRQCPWRTTGFFYEEWKGWQRSQKLEFEGDEHEKRNLGWLWAHQMTPYPGYYDTCNMNLRAWGYVFWDSDRLENLGIFKEPRPSQDCPSYPPHYSEPEIGPSVQRRLRDMRLPYNFKKWTMIFRSSTFTKTRYKHQQ